ncbi:nucleic acid-binding protein [Nostocales cyanobacterium HT-58-2]|nr:nucleic acid-binding protein [Nostocales cyanobacterium HT-58-2]
MIVVSDTSPITNLAAIGRLELLQQLYARVLIPIAVYNEMVRANKSVPGAVEVQTLPWITTRAVVDSERVTEILENQENIDLGEAEAIVLTLELNADLLLMDERRGRTLATGYGLKVTGLLGVLLQAKQNGFIPVVKPLLDQLIDQADFRVSNHLYTTILQSAGE